MDHRAFIRTLSAEQRRSLTLKSDSRGLLALTFHWGAIIAIGCLIAWRVPFWPLLLPIQGVLIVFLFTLLHETVHRTAFASQWINDWVARICGLAILLPSEWFRYFHFAHHRHTQDPENDPELADPKPETVAGYILHVSGIPIWRSHTKTLFRLAIDGGNDSFTPPSGRLKVRREARAMLGFYVALAFVSIYVGSALPVYVWIVPVLLGQPFLRLYLLAEHGRCPFVANMLENSRTTFTNIVVRQLAWNMPYHSEHHSYPVVPFYKLPELHRLVRDHLRTTERGYRRFHKAYIGDLTR